MGSNKSRTFYTQAILPGASVPIPTTSTGQGGNNSEKLKSNNLNNPPPAAKNMVRTDCREQKLEKFLVSKPAEGTEYILRQSAISQSLVVVVEMSNVPKFDI